MDGAAETSSGAANVLQARLSVDFKICCVCGDRALGYNFSAITCESCKAFFRRNALKNKEFRCPFSGNCQITAITRRFCQKCRLTKCFDVGMRKDYIMSEEDKVIKRKKIEKNRALKCSSHGRNASKVKTEYAEDSCEYLDNNASVSSVSSQCESENTYESPPKQAKFSDGPEERGDVDSGRQCSSSHAEDATSHHAAKSFPSPASATSVPSPSSPPGSTMSGSQTAELFSPTGRAAPVSVITAPAHCLSRPPARGGHDSSRTPLLSSLISPPQARPPPSHPHSPRRDSPAGRGQSSPPPEGSGGDQNCVRDFWSGYSSTREAAKEVLQDVQRIAVAPHSIESILSEAIKLEFEAYSSLAKPHQSSRQLNDAEQAKLSELVVANRALHEPLDEDLSALVGDDYRFETTPDHSPMLVDVINLTAIAIRRFIKTSKKISAFRNMCQEDQVALLKGGCTEILILRSAMTYDPDKDQWKIPHSQARLNVKVDVLKEARGNIYEEHRRFLRTFDPKWRADENIMLILSAISLFTPERQRVVHHDVIKLEQNSYYYLLRRYLESVCGGCEARSIFLKLIQKIAELHHLNDDLVRVYFDVNPRDVEPLLIEIFDLKPH
ncbi:nuclear hormone receptor HR96 [Bacillus rossius redtenbacheri]|uniref:nuclear hormone receptor HR96 n=1 Tax=Bacillus rossius redtenbacheri TaxID=93214 RepID=UPI002FDC7C17